MRTLFFLALLSLATAQALAAEATDAAADSEVGDGLVAQSDEESSVSSETDGASAAEFSDDDEDADGGFDMPVDLSFSAGIAVPMGTIAGRDPNTVTNSVLSTYSFGLGYDITDRLSASAGWGINKYLTEHSLGTRTVREAWVRDVSIGLGYGPIYTIPTADISISSSLGAVIPVSKFSRTETLRTTLSPGLSLGRSFGNFSLGYGFGFSKSFHRSTSAVVDPRRVDALRREAGAEDLARNEVAEGGVNGEWSVSHSLSASYRFPSSVGLSLSWSFADAWTYDVVPDERDEFTSEFAEPGRGHGQSMSGSFGMSYGFPFLDDHLSASLRFTTGGPPKTADNERIRFPFWDLESGNLAYTSASFSLSASY